MRNRFVEKLEWFEVGIYHLAVDLGNLRFVIKPVRRETTEYCTLDVFCCTGSTIAGVHMVVVLVDAAQLITALRLMLKLWDTPRIKCNPHRVACIVYSVSFVWLSLRGVPRFHTCESHGRVSHRL